VREILDDLTDQWAALDAVVAALDDADWDRPTPAAGWAVRDQIAHLAHYDERAATAVTAPDAFNAEVAALMADPDALRDWDVLRGRSESPAQLLERWRTGRAELCAVLGSVDASDRVVWYGPAMSAKSFATARLMETWAHGVDVTDTFGGTPEATDRLRHVAHIAVRAVPWSFTVHGKEPPQVPMRVELVAPDGEPWVWGPEDAVDVVRGPALDFCLVAVQRRHHTDVALDVSGDVARAWLDVAQAYAGPPGPGRAPA
jgi:uncharacterized protein (TIGR03084 family)